MRLVRTTLVILSSCAAALADQSTPINGHLQDDLHANTNQIKYLAPATDGMDAVNKDQLDDAVDGLLDEPAADLLYDPLGAAQDVADDLADHIDGAFVPAVSLMFKTGNQNVAGDSSFVKMTWETIVSDTDPSGVNDESLGDLVNDRFSFATAGIGDYEIRFSAVEGGDSVASSTQFNLLIRHYTATNGVTNLIASLAYASVTTPRPFITAEATIRNHGDWVAAYVQNTDSDAGVERVDAERRTSFSCVRVK